MNEEMTKQHRLRNFAVGTALVVSLLMVVVPFAPEMPSLGIDPSWIMGLNQAVIQHLGFGTQIIWTFGPFAPVYTRAYSPETDSLMLLGATYLSLAYLITLLHIYSASDRKKYATAWILIFSALLLWYPYSPDAILFVYPMLCSIAMCRMTYEHGRTSSRHATALRYATASVTFSALGFIPLTKGSALFACGPIWLLCLVYATIKKDYLLGLVILVAPLIAMAIAWCSVGQPFGSLIPFLHGLLMISSGYTDAMSTPGNPSDIVAYVVASIAVIGSLATLRSGWREKSLVMVSACLVLFLAWKAGFVRHDGHAIRSAATVMLLASIVPLAGRVRFDVFSGVIAFGCAITVGLHYAPAAITQPIRALDSHIASAIHGISSRIDDPHALEHNYTKELNSIKSNARMPILPGSSDIYPWNITTLIASGNRWNPRPVFQSYSAYTYALAKLNAAHLGGRGAPDNIFFRIEPIDGRLPSLEDGPSWSMLLSRYRPRGNIDDFLILGKNSNEIEQVQANPISDGSFNLGDSVTVPSSQQGPIVATISVNKTWRGRLLSALFKVPPLWIHITTEDGIQHSYRFVPGMANAGFVLSPLITGVTQFASLYVGSFGSRASQVRDFSITRGVGDGDYWQRQFSVTLSRLHVPQYDDALRLAGVSVPTNVASLQAGNHEGVCQGNLDVLDGMNPHAGRVARLGLVVSLRGWLANSVTARQVPASVIVILRAANGETFKVSTKRTSRDDVGQYFHVSGLPNVGFTSTFDTKFMPKGAYDLVVGYEGSDGVYLCPHMRFPVVVGR